MLVLRSYGIPDISEYQNSGMTNMINRIDAKLNYKICFDKRRCFHYTSKITVYKIYSSARSKSAFLSPNICFPLPSFFAYPSEQWNERIAQAISFRFR